MINLSSLEQLIYSAHYDNDQKEGNPRKGWAPVGLILDLSALTNNAVKEESATLKAVWSSHWDTMTTSKDAVDKIVAAIDSIRAEIKTLLNSLE